MADVGVGPTRESGGGAARGGGGDCRLDLMARVCMDVSPARLVESAEAPAGPMSFELRERMGAERRDGRKGRRRMGAGARKKGRGQGSCVHLFIIIMS